MTISHSRRIGPLLTVWVAALLLAGGLYWFQNTVPAIIDMLPPFYILLGVIVIVSTWKWVRTHPRGGDRRRGERRRIWRRHPIRRTNFDENGES